MQITVQGVPAVFTEVGKEIAPNLVVLRRVDKLAQEARQLANLETTVLSLTYTSGPGTEKTA